ncbi:MAG: hypothetical protein ACTSXH_00630 [Promethearchaeota archaeon]
MVIGSLLGGWIAAIFGIPIIQDGVEGTIPTPIIFLIGAIVILSSIIVHFFVDEVKLSLNSIKK